MISAATNIAPADAEIQELLRGLRNANLAALEERLRTARAEGSCPRHRGRRLGPLLRRRPAGHVPAGPRRRRRPGAGRRRPDRDGVLAPGVIPARQGHAILEGWNATTSYCASPPSSASSCAPGTAGSRCGRPATPRRRWATWCSRWAFR
ncbi:hypothetical protein ACFQXA_06205 [Nocardiopsis composta]